MSKPSVFISYSHKDEEWKDRLVRHLGVLQQEGLVQVWDDSRINEGASLYQENLKGMNKAKVAILLVSANSLTSQFIKSKEVSHLLRRQMAEGLRIIPVILKPCAWRSVEWLSRFQVYPHDGTPLSSKSENAIDQGLADLASFVFNQLLQEGPREQSAGSAELVAGISVAHRDVVDFECDVLVLKHAQASYGADLKVLGKLQSRSSSIEVAPDAGEHILLATDGAVKPKHVLFLGVTSLDSFDYGQIREFAVNSIHILAREMPQARHVAMTMHGVGYGLDEKESFLSQLAGLQEVFETGPVPPALERLTIVDRDKDRVLRLRRLLRQYFPTSAPSKSGATTAPRIEAGLRSVTKPHVFVAMPFSELMEDIYNFGISAPVNAAGYLCERVDMTTFTGDILARIKQRIESAHLVIADLSGANANVYLEVGYAWGKERPTLLIVRKGEDLRFDARGQRCLMYKNATELAKLLEADLKILESDSQS